MEFLVVELSMEVRMFETELRLSEAQEDKWVPLGHSLMPRMTMLNFL